jgi:hypothetical protein
VVIEDALLPISAWPFHRPSFDETVLSMHAVSFWPMLFLSPIR